MEDQEGQSTQDSPLASSIASFIPPKLECADGVLADRLRIGFPHTASTGFISSWSDPPQLHLRVIGKIVLDG